MEYGDREHADGNPLIPHKPTYLEQCALQIIFKKLFETERQQ